MKIAETSEDDAVRARIVEFLSKETSDAFENKRLHTQREFHRTKATRTKGDNFSIRGKMRQLRKNEITLINEDTPESPIRSLTEYPTFQPHICDQRILLHQHASQVALAVEASPR